MLRITVINPLTGRDILVGGATYNWLIIDAYDHINGELIRRQSAPPIAPSQYYYNIHTNRLIRRGSRWYYEYIRAGWDIEEDYYLIPPWLSGREADTIINNINRRQNVASQSQANDYQSRPISYEQIMAEYGDRLADLNISLCRKCFIPIASEEGGDHCNECLPQ